MPYFDHRFDTYIEQHAVGRYHYTVVYLPQAIAQVLPFERSARLRVEADVSGVPVKGAWQPAGGRWYLMLPRGPLRTAGLGVGSVVEVAFRVLPQDQVDLPAELSALLASDALLRRAWQAFSAGRQRGLAHWVDSARRPPTRAARLDQVREVILGLRPDPWAQALARRRAKPDGIPPRPPRAPRGR